MVREVMIYSEKKETAKGVLHPGIYVVHEIKEALEELASDLAQGKQKDPGNLRDELLHTVACKAAIKAGWHTDEAELLALVKQVMEREDLKYCPHGRPVVVKVTKYELEKLFKRA